MRAKKPQLCRRVLAQKVPEPQASKAPSPFWQSGARKPEKCGDGSADRQKGGLCPRTREAKLHAAPSQRPTSPLRISQPAACNRLGHAAKHCASVFRLNTLKLCRRCSVTEAGGSLVRPASEEPRCRKVLMASRPHARDSAMRGTNWRPCCWHMVAVFKWERLHSS